MSRRSEQFSATLHRELQQSLDRGLQDPRVSGLITITSVSVSEDLRNAAVMVSVLPAEKQELTLHGLRAAAGHLRRDVGDRINTRKIPELVFKLDESLKKQAAVMKEIARATAEREGRVDAPASGWGQASEGSTT